MSAEATSSNNNWLYAIFLSLCGSFLTNLGLVLQKWSLLNREGNNAVPSRAAPDEVAKNAQGNIKNTDLHGKADSVLEQDLKRQASSILKQPVWLLGLAIFLSGQGLHGVAFAIGPQSILGALAPFSLLTNFVLAPCILGETLIRLHFFVAVFLISATALISLHSIEPPDEHARNVDATQLAENFLHPLFLSLFLACVVLIATVGVRVFREVLNKESGRVQPQAATVVGEEKFSPPVVTVLVPVEKNISEQNATQQDLGTPEHVTTLGLPASAMRIKSKGEVEDYTPDKVVLRSTCDFLGGVATAYTSPDHWVANSFRTRTTAHAARAEESYLGGGSTSTSMLAELHDEKDNSSSKTAAVQHKHHSSSSNFLTRNFHASHGGKELNSHCSWYMKSIVETVPVEAVRARAHRCCQIQKMRRKTTTRKAIDK
ncbi:unnamed protein product [Amoebophrya sp. A120]|nr:unnamed protein product [Amoebophrya sp. A120]|eukprot:GSA120T00007983001.1